MKTMIRLCMVVGVLAAAPVFATDDPNELIVSAVDELAKGLDGRKIELSEDRAALKSLIDSILLPRFDRRYAAQLVLGRYWRTANKEQQERFINAFYQTLMARYADGVLEFDENRIEVLPFRGAADDKRTTVRTEVRLDDGTKVPVNYGLVKRNDGWKVYDVTIEGISYVRNYRTELNDEIASKGLDAVIQRLESESGIDASGDAPTADKTAAKEAA